MNWKIGTWKKSVGRSVLAIALSAGVVGGMTSYELLRPTNASAAVPMASSSPLDDNSVGALLALDNAMETLAKRVTPAVVNVTVTSKAKPDQRASQGAPDDDDMQNFFGQFFGGRNVPQMQQRQPQVAHGLGSG